MSCAEDRNRQRDQARYVVRGLLQRRLPVHLRAAGSRSDVSSCHPLAEWRISVYAAVMNIFPWVLVVATFLSALMAGFLFAFAVIVMPGIKNLSDREFLQGFQAIDRVIQNGQPLFMVMWLGSTVALIAAAALSIRYQTGLDRMLLVGAALASVLLVQLPTMRINIPLNNQVQSLDFESLGGDEARQAREAFELRWIWWNNIRTVVSVVILGMLLVVLLRL